VLERDVVEIEDDVGVRAASAEHFRRYAPLRLELTALDSHPGEHSMDRSLRLARLR
jgi:hypothetical protein